MPRALSCFFGEPCMVGRRARDLWMAPRKPTFRLKLLILKNPRFPSKNWKIFWNVCAVMIKYRPFLTWEMLISLPAVHLFSRVPRKNNFTFIFLTTFSLFTFPDFPANTAQLYIIGIKRANDIVSFLSYAVISLLALPLSGLALFHGFRGQTQKKTCELTEYL